MITKKFSVIKRVDDLKVSKGGFWSLMFSEFVSFYGKIPFREYRTQSLGLYEKFLRILKVISLKVENKTSKWLEKLPKEKSKKTSKSSFNKREQIEVESISKEDIQLAKENNFRKEEKRLITEITKFPKNADLYKELGILYISNKALDDAKEALKVAVQFDSEDKEIGIILEKISK